MKYGYQSDIVAFKCWKRQPVWADKDGKTYKVSLVISAEKLKEVWWQNFIKYNQSIYPDLKYVGLVEKVVTSGVKKPNPVKNYQGLN